MEGRSIQASGNLPVVINEEVKLKSAADAIDFVKRKYCKGDSDFMSQNFCILSYFKQTCPGCKIPKKTTCSYFSQNGQIFMKANGKTIGAFGQKRGAGISSFDDFYAEAIKLAYPKSDTQGIGNQFEYCSSQKLLSVKCTVEKVSASKGEGQSKSSGWALKANGETVAIAKDAADIQQSFNKMVNGENNRPFKLCKAGKNEAEDGGAEDSRAHASSRAPKESSLDEGPHSKSRYGSKKPQ